MGAVASLDTEYESPGSCQLPGGGHGPP